MLNSPHNHSFSTKGNGLRMKVRRKPSHLPPVTTGFNDREIELMSTPIKIGAFNDASIETLN